MEEFVKTLVRLEASELDSFLGIGRRLDVKLEREFDFDQASEVEDIRRRASTEGVLSARVCKEYFAFTRNIFETIPDFAVGRGNWDNWMVATARRRGIPVVNLRQGGTVIHQVHDYGHSASNRLEVYVTGSEARENERLAGGKNVVTGSSSTWELTENGLRKRPLSFLNLDFWTDLPRFCGLLGDLWRSRNRSSEKSG